ncbi:MAG TPA: response regulator [Pirellulales bacterium]|nr:response regulator [Pirellulales bacterium]
MQQERPFADVPLRIVFAAADDARQALLLSAASTQSGCDFVRAGSLTAVLGYLSGQSCDVVVLDAQLGNGNNRATLAALRQADPSISIVLVVAESDDATRETALARGALAVLSWGELSDGALDAALQEATQRRRYSAASPAPRGVERPAESQRLETAGSLASGIAHVFNNLLQVIRGYTRYAMEGLPVDDQRYQDLEQVMNASDRAAALTRQLQGFSPRLAIHRQAIYSGKFAARLIEVLKPLLDHRIELETDLAADVGSFSADPELLHQALLDLCLNARDSMPDGGTLMLRTERVELGEHFCQFHPLAQPGTYLLLSVADTGCGVPLEERGRLFDPFFASNEARDGRGRALASVYGIVQQHGGLIHVFSEPRVGTNFKIYLPLGAPAEAGERLGGGEEAGEGVTRHDEGETILLAEDEPMVRALATRMLSQAGYSVIAASDGAEAVRLFDANQDAIDLALLDAVMPNLNGRDVYEHIKRSNKSLPVLFCSGYAPETGEVRFLVEAGVQLIEKPFDPDVLLASVRQALDCAKGALDQPALAGA